MPIDLLPVGEQLSGLDLVVRQLDDGSLSVTADGALPDGERVRVAAAGQGLRAWLPVGTLAAGQASRAAAALGPLNQTIADGGGRGALMVRGSEVRFEVGLDHPSPYTADELQALYRAAVEGGAAQRAAVARVVAETAPTVVAPTVVAPTADAANAALPSSFLPGAGQRPRESATERFGALGKTPGRGELSADERGAVRRARGGGGGGGVFIALGLIGLAGAGGAAVVVFRDRSGPATAPAVEQGEPSPGSGPATPAPNPGDAPAVTPLIVDEAVDATTPPTATTARIDEETPAIPRRQPAAAASEDDVLVRARDPEARLAAVEAWLRDGLDGRPGARRRMLEALGDGIEADPKVGRLVMQSLRDRPPTVAEAIECLGQARGGVKRALVAVLGEATGEAAKAAVEALAAVEDTPDLVVDEALLKLGQPRAGAALRLATARGPEWVLFGDGYPLLTALARRDVKQVESLLQHADVEVRLSACALIAGAEQPREALALLAPVLRDAEPRVRARAAEGLTSLADPRASWPLARALTREDSNQTRDVIVDGLQRLPLKDTVELLGRLYASKEPNERRAAVMGLNAIGKPEAITGLVAALRDADRAVRLEALRALDASYGKPALRPRVAEGLAAIRELGLDRTDREVWAIARQLHYQITGRMPDATVRDRGTR